MQQKNNTITLMKTLVIICMVAGHSYTGSPIESFVGLFHMPVFFFCSGFCFKEKYLSDFNEAYSKLQTDVSNNNIMLWFRLE